MPSVGLGWVLNIISGTVAGVLTYVIYEFHKERFYVKRVLRDSDQDLEGFFELYQKLVRDDFQLPPERFMSWIRTVGTKQRGKALDFMFTLLLAKARGVILGYLSFDYFFDSKLMFISYFGIDGENGLARTSASLHLLKKVRRLLASTFKGCRGILFEIEKPDSSLRQREFRRRMARKQLFMATAVRERLKAYELDFAYLAPRISAEDLEGNEEEQMVLMYIPVGSTPVNRTITKTEVLDLLRVVYLQVYAEAYREDPETYAAYKEYLVGLLNKAASLVPEVVHLR